MEEGGSGTWSAQQARYNDGPPESSEHLHHKHNSHKTPATLCRDMRCNLLDTLGFTGACDVGMCSGLKAALVIPESSFDVDGT